MAPAKACRSSDFRSAVQRLWSGLHGTRCRSPCISTEHYDTDPDTYVGIKPTANAADAFQPELKTARLLLPHLEGGTALDIGAGTGGAMAALRAAGFDVWGLEPSTRFRERALGTYNFPPDRLRLGSIEDVSFPADSFDLVTFGAVLEHLPDPSAALEKALSWLRPNGIVHVEVPSTRWLIGRLLNIYYRLIGSGLVTNLSPMHPPYHLYEFTEEAFVQNWAKARIRDRTK